MFCQEKNTYEVLTDKQIESAYLFCEDYKNFLNTGKTERESAQYIVERALKEGFSHYDGGRVSEGQRLIFENRGKGVMLVVVGSEPMESGLNIIVSHIDAPRIDLKQIPVREESELSYFATHYYGGIKKYQWTAIPLALHGVVVKADGTRIDVCIGENEKDPVFTITDLLPHLAAEQMKKTMSEGITGEDLKLLSGSRPGEGEKEKTKGAILKLLKERYDIEEEDLSSAELEIVPAFKSQDVGLDRSMVGGYGQDDRVCAYAALRAILEIRKCRKTAVALFMDKEEIGSVGNTGAQSRFFEFKLAELLNGQSGQYSDLCLQRALSNSRCLSADVGAAFDPLNASVHDKANSPQINHGVLITKYTGSRGKSGASDAGAEFVGEIRKLFNESGVPWQTGELGKVDQGGGGTIAFFLANLDMEVIDCGVPVLSMHSPFEVTGKLDIYSAYMAYDAFFR